jgi:hypothetical protein
MRLMKCWGVQKRFSRIAEKHGFIQELMDTWFPSGTVNLAGRCAVIQPGFGLWPLFTCIPNLPLDDLGILCGCTATRIRRILVAQGVEIRPRGHDHGNGRSTKFVRC